MDKKHQKTVAVDVDGVIADYSKGFQGEDIIGDPLPGAAEALTRLRREGWRIIIFTTRGNLKGINEYLKRNGIPFDYINTNPDNPPGTNAGKPIADVYVDDRALNFSGSWPSTLEKIKNFKPWQKKG